MAHRLRQFRDILREIQQEIIPDEYGYVLNVAVLICLVPIEIPAMRDIRRNQNSVTGCKRFRDISKYSCTFSGDHAR